MVPNLNSDLLHGLTDSAFAKLGASNVFSDAQTFSAGMQLPASALEPNSTGLFDSAPLSFESSSTDPGTNTSISQLFSWASRPAGSTAQLFLSFGSVGTKPTPTGLSINSDGTINFSPNQQLPSSAVVSALTGAGSGGAGSGTDNPVVNTAPYSWSQTASLVMLIQPGTNNVTLTPCPKGVNGTDLWHYLYISRTGTPEIVLITGGSCTSRAPSGTVEFTAIYPHAGGYSVGSATDGVQEAVIDAYVQKSGTLISRQVMIDPGHHLFRARMSIRGSALTINSSGATITCAMKDTCIMMGDPSNADGFSSIVLNGLRLSPAVQQGTWPAVEDDANGSTINDLAPAASAPGASFGYLVQVDNDQAATITGLSTTTNFQWGRCDTSFCSTAVYGPGPFSTRAGVLWVQNSNLSMQGFSNGIDNQDGNTLQVSNTVVQGYAQFGIRAKTVFQPTTVTLTNVYFEVDSNANPLGTGSAGLIVEGGKAVSSGSNPVGAVPQFANTGTTQYFYYIVVHSSTLGTSPVYSAGNANTNGSGPIRVLWNQVGTAGVITYDVLRITGSGNASMQAPYGTGPFAVAAGVPAATSCSNKVCSIIDDAASSPSAYTVSDDIPYWPALTLWPGTVILTTAFDLQDTGGSVPTQYFTDSLAYGGVVASAGATQPSVFAQQCDPLTGWSSIWLQCVGGSAASNDYPPVVATVLQQAANGGNSGGLKGREIFEIPDYSSLAATEVITLGDSNPDKTMATPGNRASWDPNDTYIGLDQPNASPLSGNLQWARQWRSPNISEAYPTGPIILSGLQVLLNPSRFPYK